MRSVKLAGLLALSLFFLGCGGDGADDSTDASVEMDAPDSSDSAEEAEGIHIYTTSSGFGFEPQLVTVAVDEDVHIHLEPGHTAVEVDFETWQKSKLTPLAGGFYFGLNEGGGTVQFDKPGNHYFICLPHAEMDERGQITVE